MSFQFPEQVIPSSASPSPDCFPRALAMRETADIPAALSADERERAARRINRKVLDAFWLDMGFCHNSARIQTTPHHPLREYYDGRARANRERIARERE